MPKNTREKTLKWIDQKPNVVAPQPTEGEKTEEAPPEPTVNDGKKPPLAKLIPMN